MTTAGCAATRTAAPVAPVASAQASGVAGELEQVTPAVSSATAVVSFHNSTDRDLRIVRFRVSWRGGSVVVRPVGLHVPAATSRQAELRIGPESGDLYALYDAPMGARVDVLEVR